MISSFPADLVDVDDVMAVREGDAFGLDDDEQ